MKQYSGMRTIDGIVVSVDGAPLDPRFDLHTFDDKGFEWSYEGSAPQQLAFAILVDHLGDAAQAQNAAATFMQSVIADLDNDWTLSSEEVARALAGIDGAAR